MAHIPDGVLSVPVLAGGALVSVCGIGLGLNKIQPEKLPQVAVMASAFFVASLIHFPVGPTSVHLMLNGLMGVCLGLAAYPAIAVALLLQAVLFGFGGLMVLGVNAMNMAVPAIVAFLSIRPFLRAASPRRAAMLGGLAGAMTVLMTGCMVALSLALSGREFLPAMGLIVASYIPVMVVEAVFAAAATGLLARVKPEMLGGGDAG